MCNHSQAHRELLPEGAGGGFVPLQTGFSDGKLNKACYLKMVNMDSLYKVMHNMETIEVYVVDMHHFICGMSYEQQVTCKNLFNFHDNERAFNYVLLFALRSLLN